jgi:hypothetical protein
MSGSAGAKAQVSGGRADMLRAETALARRVYHRATVDLMQTAAEAPDDLRRLADLADAVALEAGRFAGFLRLLSRES